MRKVCLFLLALVAMLSSCKSVREVERVYVHDTARVVDVRHDSVDRWHTHYEYLMGDTIRIVDSVYLYIGKTTHDTIEKVKNVVEYRDKEVVKEKKVYVWYPCIIVIALILVGFIAYIFVGVRKNLTQ